MIRGRVQGSDSLKMALKRKILIMIKYDTETNQRELVLGDYVTVHVTLVKTDEINSTAPADMQVHREELFKRIQKQRGEICRRVKKPEGRLLDPRRRALA